MTCNLCAYMGQVVGVIILFCMLSESIIDWLIIIIATSIAHFSW